MARPGTVDDVAAVVRFLLGPESSWITGECLGVDGGHHLRQGPDIEHWARAIYGDDAVEGRYERGHDSFRPVSPLHSVGRVS